MCVEGDVLVSASLDGDIRVWSANPGSKRCLRTIIRRYPPIVVCTTWLVVSRVGIFMISRSEVNFKEFNS